MNEQSIVHRDLAASLGAACLRPMVWVRQEFLEHPMWLKWTPKAIKVEVLYEEGRHTVVKVGAFRYGLRDHCAMHYCDDGVLHLIHVDEHDRLGGMLELLLEMGKDAEVRLRNMMRIGHDD